MIKTKEASANEIRDFIKQKNRNVLYYGIYTYPQRPTENGKYRGKTPILEQAMGVVEAYHQKGIELFIKCFTDDGRYINLLYDGKEWF